MGIIGFSEASLPDRHQNGCQFSRILGYLARPLLLFSLYSSGVFFGALPRKEFTTMRNRTVVKEY